MKAQVWSRKKFSKTWLNLSVNTISTSRRKPLDTTMIRAWSRKSTCKNLSMRISRAIERHLWSRWSVKITKSKVCWNCHNSRRQLWPSMKSLNRILSTICSTMFSCGVRIHKACSIKSWSNFLTRWLLRNPSRPLKHSRTDLSQPTLKSWKCAISLNQRM